MCFLTIFQDFCNAYSLAIAVKDVLPIDTLHILMLVLLRGLPRGFIIQIIIICTSDAKGCSTNMKVYYEFIHSDHHSLMFKSKSDIIPEYANSVETVNATNLCNTCIP